MTGGDRPSSEVRPDHVHLGSKPPTLRGQAGGRDDSHGRGTARASAHVPCEGQPLLSASSVSARCPGFRFSEELEIHFS